MRGCPLAQAELYAVPHISVVPVNNRRIRELSGGGAWTRTTGPTDYEATFVALARYMEVRGTTPIRYRGYRLWHAPPCFQSPSFKFYKPTIDPALTECYAAA